MFALHCSRSDSFATVACFQFEILKMSHLHSIHSVQHEQASAVLGFTTGGGGGGDGDGDGRGGGAGGGQYISMCWNQPSTGMALRSY